MIKLNEEPITYVKFDDTDLDNIEIWIYKNPDSKEVEELRDYCDSVRIITLGEDYYVASSYYFTHGDMSDKINKDEYYDLIYWFKRNILSIHKYINRKMDLSSLKPVYDKMMDAGLIDNKTVFINGRGGYDDSDDNRKPRLTLGDARKIDRAEFLKDD